MWWGGGTTVTVWEGGRGVDPGERGWGVCSNTDTGGCVMGWRDHCHSVGRGVGEGRGGLQQHTGGGGGGGGGGAIGPMGTHRGVMRVPLDHCHNVGRGVGGAKRVPGGGSVQ